MGVYHTHHCEDYLFTDTLSDNTRLFVVMDGCSAGTDSQFATVLSARIFRKLAREFNYKTFLEKQTPSLRALQRQVLQRFFEELKAMKNHLQLNLEEMLHTLLMAIVNTDTGEAEIICLGDGLICIDGQYHEFDQDNRPDYPAYHLQKDFDSWYAAQQQLLSVKGFRDLSLCSDGIFTFAAFDRRQYAAAYNIPDYLLCDTSAGETAFMLNRKVIEIQEQGGLKPMDDLAVIRIILPEKV